MTPQERELIEGVARRLRDARLPDKDLEADRLIRAEIGSQPDALYLLTQTVIVQEQGLRRAEERLRQSEGQGAGSGSFLGGQPAGGVPTVYPVGSPPGRGGGSAAGSFLRTAAAAAAGAVGGQLILDGLRHWAGGGPVLPAP